MTMQVEPNAPSPRRRRRRTSAAALAVLALGAGACTDRGGDPTPQASPFFGIRSAPVALVADRSCDAVLEDLRATATDVVTDQLAGWVAMDARALEEGSFDDVGGVAMDTDAGAAPTAAPSVGADAAESSAADDGSTQLAYTGDGDSSDTNVQESGIDEPDVVENDGEHVYVVDGEELVILDGATAAVVSRTPLEAYGAQLLLQGDRLLVISDAGYRYYEGDVVEPAFEEVGEDLGEQTEGSEGAGTSGSTGSGVATPAVEPGQPIPVEPDGGTGGDPDVDPIPLPAPEPGPGPEPAPFEVGTVLRLFDVTDPAGPTVVQTVEVEGYHVSTRVVDGVARVVVQSYPQPSVATQGAADDAAIAIEEVAKRAVDDGDVDAAIAEVRSIVGDAVAQAEIGDFLPAVRTTTVDAAGVETAETTDLVSCEDIWMPEVNAGLAETSVLRVDFADGFDPADTTTVVAEAQTVYASARNLYVAANTWTPIADQGVVDTEGYATAIQVFDLTGDGPAAHLGAGVVPGHLVNQYALSEWDGHLRVAATEGATWDAQDPSSSSVRILRLADPVDGVLVETGAVTGLGITETIQSVRFMGELGYVVTFRQTDPLYVVDLADPTAPEAIGELKIPGFSSYLHPIGEGRLIGIGRDATEEGFDTGLLVSLFDVTDPRDPTQVATYTERDAYSAAGWDPKAFLWWAPESVLAIPIERYSSGGIVDDVIEVPVDDATDGELERPATRTTDADGNVSTDSVDVAEEPPADELPPDVGISSEPFVQSDYVVGIAVLDVDVAGASIAERGVVTQDGRYPSRALVVQGRLWSLFDGGVAVSDFADVTAATFAAYR